MNVSKTDATDALDVIAHAKARMLTLRRYASLAPFILTWGVVWVAANVITDLAPEWTNRAWLVGTVSGVVISMSLGIHLARRARARTDSDDARRRMQTQRFVLLGVAFFGYFPATFAVLGPLSGRQGNAFISLFWAFAYMIIGAWVGWRLFAIGAVTAAAVLFGYLTLEQHYYLWMAACGGGALIGGGLWLRTV